MACIIEKPANLLHETAAEKEDIEKTDKWKIEQIYRNILENSGDAILIADLNVRVVTVNRATLQMLDFETEDELLGKFLFELGPSEGIFTSTTGEVITFDKTWLDMQVNIPNTLFKKGTVNCEIYLLKKDGTIVPVEATLSLLQNRVGDIIGSISICRDITERRVARQKLQQAHEDLEKKVQERTHNLEEVNTALQVLLRNREKDQKVFEKKILFNVEKLILPYLESLKKCCSENRQKTFLRILETNIKEMIAPYAHQLSTKYLKLTPTEIQVANFIRQGQSTKEIAETLSLSAKTIATHRRNIRVKLGLKNQKANLRSSLQAIQ
jgi:DNA-binding CsgD family transcriptional regulator